MATSLAGARPETKESKGKKPDKPYEIEVFRVGTHVSSDGREIPFSVEDVDRAIQNYRPEHFRVPLIVSHETGNYSDQDIVQSELAFGVVEYFRRVGDRVFAVFKKIAPEFKNWVKNGQLHSISASFYLPSSPHNPNPGELSWRHIAALGRNPPAVKGLSPIVLSECVVFSEKTKRPEGTADFMIPCGMPANAIVAVLLRNLRDWMIDSNDLETAERLMPSEMLYSLEQHNSQIYVSLEDFTRLQSDLAHLFGRVDGLSQRQAERDLQDAILDEVMSSYPDPDTESEAPSGSQSDSAWSPYYSPYYSEEIDMTKTYKKSMAALMQEAGIESVPQLMQVLEMGEGEEDLAQSFMDGHAAMPLDKRKRLAKKMRISDAEMEGKYITDDEMSLREEIAALKAAQEEADARAAALQQEVIAQRTAARKAEITSFLESLKREGRITSGMVRPQIVTFGEGDAEQKRTIDLVSFMAALPDDQQAFVKQILRSLPTQVIYQEISSNDAEPVTGETLDFIEVGNLARQKIREYRNQGRELSESQAVDMILAERGVRL